MEFFTNTGPFCDIQTRYDHRFYTKYNPNSVQNKLDWNPSETFKQYLMAVKERQYKEESQETEDALMAVIDSMNASEDESGASRDQAVTNALQSASAAVSRKMGGKGDPTTTLSVRMILSCLGDRVQMEMTDEVQDEHEKQLQEIEKDETVKGGEEDECSRPVHDAANAADVQWNGEPAQNPQQRQAGGQ